MPACRRLLDNPNLLLRQPVQLVHQLVGLSVEGGDLTLESLLVVVRLRSRELAVNMTAGELHVSGVDACLSVDMGAGDVEIQAPADMVGRVALDAGIGDAHLSVGESSYEAPRSWLIGAELLWEQGTGPCDLVVDLQAGDINVSLD